MKFLLSISVVVVLSLPVLAGTYHVPGDFSDAQSAIDAAAPGIDVTLPFLLVERTTVEGSRSDCDDGPITFGPDGPPGFHAPVLHGGLGYAFLEPWTLAARVGDVAAVSRRGAPDARRF